VYTKENSIAGTPIPSYPPHLIQLLSADTHADTDNDKSGFFLSRPLPYSAKGCILFGNKQFIISQNNTRNMVFLRILPYAVDDSDRHVDVYRLLKVNLEVPCLLAEIPPE
jgi:hypothetical protein